MPPCREGSDAAGQRLQRPSTAVPLPLALPGVVTKKRASKQAGLAVEKRKECFDFLSKAASALRPLFKLLHTRSSRRKLNGNLSSRCSARKREPPAREPFYNHAKTDTVLSARWGFLQADLCTPVRGCAYERSAPASV